MTLSLVDGIEDVISKTDCLYIPEQYASEIKAGDRALLFLNSIFKKGITDDQGVFNGEFETGLGICIGERLTEDSFFEPPIFTIERDRLNITETTYSSCGIMENLTYANK